MGSWLMEVGLVVWRVWVRFRPVGLVVAVVGGGGLVFGRKRRKGRWDFGGLYAAGWVFFSSVS